MFTELVKSLTKEEIDELVSLGVARSTVSAWRTGKRLPTRPQTVHLAQVKHVDVITLEAELMLMEAAPEQRDLFRRILSEAGAAIALFILIFGMLGAPEKAIANQRLAMHISSDVKYTS